MAEGRPLEDMKAHDGKLELLVPAGWTLIRHERHEQPCWFHAASRTMSWTPPYTLSDLGLAATHEPPQTTPSVLVEALAAKQLEDIESHGHCRSEAQDPHRLRMIALGRRELTPEEELERELSALPPLTSCEFIERGSGSLGRSHASVRGHQAVPCEFLQAYAAAVLGARAKAELDVPAGPWAQPPQRCRVIILGIVASEALHSVKDTARALAFEEAALVLCPHIYADKLRHRGLRPPRLLRPVITDMTLPAALGVDDERVLELDLCVSQSPAMMVNARPQAPTLQRSARAHHTCSHIGARVRSRCLLQSAALFAHRLCVVRHSPGQVQSYVSRMHGQQKLAMSSREATKQLGSGSRLVHGYEYSVAVGSNVYSGFDVVEKRAKQRACIRLLCAAHPEATTWQHMIERYPSEGSQQLQRPAARSHAADQLLKADLRRSVPGTGSDFAPAWQHQEGLDRPRSAALSEVVDTENDTPFALAVDKDGERIDHGRLERLRLAVCELERAQIMGRICTEDEPALLHVLQEDASRVDPADVDDASERAAWGPGTAADSKLMALAGLAPPVQTVHLGAP